MPSHHIMAAHHPPEWTRQDFSIVFGPNHTGNRTDQYNLFWAYLLDYLGPLHSVHSAILPIDGSTHVQLSFDHNTLSRGDLHDAIIGACCRITEWRGTTRLVMLLLHISLVEGSGCTC